MESKERMKGNRNELLNFFKGIGCIGVVFIHIRFPGMTGEIISTLASFAVPMFFMISGYYSWECSKSTISRRLIKVIKIFIYGYALFLAYNIAVRIKNQILIEWLKENFNVCALIKGVIFCTIDFAIPLWYLIAMAETYLLWYLVVKTKREKILLTLMPVLFAAQLLGTTICETNGYEWFWKINFMTQALPWFLFGYYAHSAQIEKTKDIILITAVASGCVIALIPVIFETGINFSCIGTLIYSMALFTIGIKYSEQSPCKMMTYIGDKLSLNIYICHGPIAGVISFICKRVCRIDINGIAFCGADRLLLWRQLSCSLG